MVAPPPFKFRVAVPRLYMEKLLTFVSFMLVAPFESYQNEFLPPSPYKLIVEKLPGFGFELLGKQ